MGPGQGQPFQVDPARAFHKLQQRHAEESARWAGDLAAKDAAIDQLAEENQMLRGQIEMLNQQLERYQDQENQVKAADGPGVIDVATPPNGNGPIPSIPSEEHVSVPTMIVGPPPEQ